MASPYQYPWVRFLKVPTQGVDSTPLALYTAPVTTLVDVIRVCNTTSVDIYVNFYLLSVRSAITIKSFLENNFLVPRFASASILTGYPQTMQTGDILYGYSDFS